MNKILFNKSQKMSDGALLIPFVCSDAKDMHLHEPVYNRSEAENDMARNILVRVKKALDTAGYEMLNFSFSSWTLTVKKK